MSIEEEIRKIKKALRSNMNGVLSAQMREAGMPYKLVFGVQLPALQHIASEFQPNRKLAQALWNESIRESKMLACMLMPADEFTSEIADIWVQEIPTAEIAQIFVMHLFCKSPKSAETAFEWIASEEEKKQLCGFLCLARFIGQGTEINERSLLELADQAHALLPNADLHLRKAIHAVLAKIDKDFP